MPKNRTIRGFKRILRKEKERRVDKKIENREFENRKKRIENFKNRTDRKEQHQNLTIRSGTTYNNK